MVPCVKATGNYDFVGWISSLDDKTYTSKEVQEMKITEDITFTAKYHKQPIIFIPNTATKF